MTDKKKPKPAELSEVDLANEQMGRNALQGDDQLQVPNQRRAVPDAKKDTDGLIESFEKLDKDKRAEEDLGKGNRDSARASD